MKNQFLSKIMVIFIVVIIMVKHNKVENRDEKVNNKKPVLGMLLGLSVFILAVIGLTLSLTNIILDTSGDYYAMSIISASILFVSAFFLNNLQNKRATPTGSNGENSGMILELMRIIVISTGLLLSVLTSIFLVLVGASAFYIVLTVLFILSDSLYCVIYCYNKRND